MTGGGEGARAAPRVGGGEGGAREVDACEGGGERGGARAGVGAGLEGDDWFDQASKQARVMTA